MDQENDSDDGENEGVDDGKNIEQAGSEEAAEEPDIALEDFVLAPEGNVGVNVDGIAREIGYLTQQQQSPSASFETTMFVIRKADSERFVIKRITPDSFSKSISKLELAVREARTLTALVHVNLVRVHQVFDEKRHLYLLTEFVEGGNLANVISRQRGELFDEETVMGWFRQMVEGVRYLHSKYVVHGDIKPQNILLSSSLKTLRLSDFALKKVLDSVGSTFLDRPGYSANQLYTAPELNSLFDDLQLLNSGKAVAYPNDDIFSIAEKADIWSLGVVAYEIMSQKKPFSSLKAAMTQIPDGLPNIYQKALRDLVIVKMLAKLPWDRIDIMNVSKEEILTVKRILRQPKETKDERKKFSSRDDENLGPADYTGADFDNFQALITRAVADNSPSRLLEASKEALAKSEKLLRKILNFKADNQAGNTLLHRAAKDGFDEVVKILCKLGADVDAFNRALDTPILLGATAGHAKVVAELLDGAANPNVIGSADRAAIHIACAAGFVGVVQALAKHPSTEINLQSHENDQEVTGLHLAAYFGHDAIIDALCNGGASMSIIDKNRDMALHAAARNNQIESCKVLLRRGAKINAFGYQARTPLHHAIHAGFDDMVDFLLQKGADVQAKSPKDKQGRTPLHMAVGRKNISILNILLKHKASWFAGDVAGETVLHMAVAKGYVAMADFLISKGMPIDTPNEQNGQTALHTAAAAGQRDSLLLLIKRHALVDALAGETCFHQTPLHFAVREGHVECARLLLQSGAELMKLDSENHSTLALAVKSDHSSAVRMLILNFGAPVNGKNTDGDAPLHIACKLDKYYAARALLEQMASVELCNNRGMTPFAVAVENGSGFSAELLWSWGCVANTADLDGNLPIHLAVKKGHIDMIVFLAKRARVNLEAVGEGLRTPLQLACSINQVEAVDTLLKLRANRDVRTGEDVAQTPLQIAAVNGFGKIVHLLIKAHVMIDGRNFQDETALMLAASARQAECVRLLAGEGKANVEALGVGGRRPLHYAVEANSEKVVTLLVRDFGAMADARDDNKETPLFLAARLGYVDVAKVLVQFEPKLLDTLNEQGKTVAQVAEENEHPLFFEAVITKNNSDENENV